MNQAHWRPAVGPCRIGRVLRRLVAASEGVETIEFALVSLALFLFMFGVVEFGRLYWTQSELQYAAEAAARCATVGCCSTGPLTCGGLTGNLGLQNYTAGQVYGLSIAGSDLSNFSLTAATCGNQVSFNYTFNFIVTQLLPQGTITLATTACHQA